MKVQKINAIENSDLSIPNRKKDGKKGKDDKKGKGKGKAKGKGKGKSEGKGPQSSGDGQKKVCWYHQQGTCLKGANCPWPHAQAQVQALKGKKGDGKKGGKGKGKGKGPTWMEGDWECPNIACKDHQFAANTKCRKCGTAKPTHV